MIRRCIFLFFIAIAFSLIALVSLKYASGDFDVYYSSSQHYLAKAPVYVPHGGIDEFKYSPLFALCFAPLTFFNEYTAMFLWTVLNVAFLFCIFFLFYKLKFVSFDQPKDLLIVIGVFALTGNFIFLDFRLGQVNVLLCLLMALIMYFEINKKDFWASVALAFSLMIKFIPLLFVAYFILKGRFKLLAYTLLMLAVFLFLPSLYTGFDLNLKYLHEWWALLHSTPAVIIYSPKNSSLLSFFSWIFILRHEAFRAYNYISLNKPLTLQVYCAWAISCFVLFNLFYRDKILYKDGVVKSDPYSDYACLFVCGLLFNPLAYENALTLLVVPYFFILRQLFYGSLNKSFRLLIGSILSFCFIITISDNRIFFKSVEQHYAYLELKPLLWVILLVYMSLYLNKFQLKQKI